MDITPEAQAPAALLWVGQHSLEPGEMRPVPAQRAAWAVGASEQLVDRPEISVPFRWGFVWLQRPTWGHTSTQRMLSRMLLGFMGLCQLLLVPIPEPRDVGSHTLTPLVWPVGVGDGNWLVEGLGVGQGLPAFPSLGDALFLPGHIGEAGAVALCTSEMGSRAEATGEGGISGGAGAACAGFLAAEPRVLSATLARAV